MTVGQSIYVAVCWQKARMPGGRWTLEWRPVENGLPALICLADREPPVITDCYLVPKLISSTPNAILLTKDHPLLQREGVSNHSINSMTRRGNSSERSRHFRANHSG